MSNEQWAHAPDPTDVEATDKLVMLTWAGLFFALALFSALPGLDLIVSAKYFQAGKGFVHSQDPFVLALYKWTPWIGRCFMAGVATFAMLASMLARWARWRRRDALSLKIQGPWRHIATVTVCCALLGNGLLIEGVLKTAMGRPRPMQVQAFAGTDAYCRPFKPCPDPSHHRSFVSSHAAAGFALMSLGLTCGPLWRRRWLLISMVVGGVIGLGRMLQGGHFLSDIVFSFYSIWLSCEFVAWLDRKHSARKHPGRRQR